MLKSREATIELNNTAFSVVQLWSVETDYLPCGEQLVSMEDADQVREDYFINSKQVDVNIIPPTICGLLDRAVEEADFN